MALVAVKLLCAQWGGVRKAGAIEKQLRAAKVNNKLAARPSVPCAAMHLWTADLLLNRLVDNAGDTDPIKPFTSSQPSAQNPCRLAGLVETIPVPGRDSSPREVHFLVSMH